MQIRWLGHASFVITTLDKTKIITDPYETGGGINYKPINESADIVTQSHNHGDHNNARAIKNNPVILTKAGTQVSRGISIKAIPSFHDETQGSLRGQNLIFCFNADAMNLCHLGDLGHTLNQKHLAEIGPVDILIIPVGGFFTINARAATEIVQNINPRLVIPMHYRNPGVDLPIAGVDDFLKGKSNVRRLNSNEIEVKKEDLPEQTEIAVLLPPD
ncbi:MAG: MBL fold metallo-hydrolase [Dehalococcoidales bacterium]|nr:MBL fold metallo-hydrolase [Dehalococcoidales bacterium]